MFTDRASVDRHVFLAHRPLNLFEPNTLMILDKCKERNVLYLCFFRGVDNINKFKNIFLKKPYLYNKIEVSFFIYN